MKLLELITLMSEKKTVDKNYWKPLLPINFVSHITIVFDKVSKY